MPVMNIDFKTRAFQFRVCPVDDYRRYVAGHTLATPYHDPAWLQATERAYGHTGWLITAYGKEGLCGVLPLVEVKPPFGAGALVSLPFCDLGGVLADSEKIREELINEAHTLARVQGVKTLELREGGAALEEKESAERELSEDTKVRMLCELPHTSDALFKSYKPKLRSQIRKAEKNGLRAELFTGADAISLFYGVFSKNMRRLGSPVHSLRWFQDLKIAYGDQLLTGVVFQNDKPIGAGIVLLGGKQACIPWASTLEEANHLAPNMLLYWTLLSRMCDLGCTLFDFGRSTLGEGTYRFKKQWGARPYQLTWTEYTSGARHATVPEPADTSLLAISRVRPLIETVWRQLPLALTNWLGPKLRRYITL